MVSVCELDRDQLTIEGLTIEDYVIVMDTYCDRY
jgi:hypothetical protein